VECLVIRAVLEIAETNAKPSPARLPRLDAVGVGGDASPHVFWAMALLSLTD
jgi:hypothetical protein